ncbi:MAG: 2-oxoacid:acceptor oxidoreductase subunit alpha [Candidatus Pacebacteria bacterium]|nr:2-oxoacid:acceptor oxidoreductase subunit alpha [Candidatus Paceibacterota bacterium]
MSTESILFNWKIGGEAGFGVKSAGLSFSKACARAGYETFDYTEYPSLIRGGHNTYQVAVSDKAVGSVSKKIDFLVALDKATIDNHSEELAEGSAIIYDGEEMELSAQEFKKKGINLISVPLNKFAAENGGRIMRNAVSVGATLALVNMPLNIMEKVIKEIFGHKPEAVEQNMKAVELGYNYVKEKYGDFNFKVKLEIRKNKERVLVSGNEALGMGALAAGMNFFTSYPMTPATSIMQFLAGEAVKEGVIIKHAEDEISVVNMALGAAHAGARAMCTTSGGGFSLMVESLGLCAITETPLVLVDVQRPGPATGMPTWTEQGDLQFVLHSAQGEFPRIILAPGDLEECFYQGAEAFNLAEKYQMPVIILSDKFLGEGTGTSPVFDAKKISVNRGKLLKESEIPEDYKRYKITADGISERTLPGMKNGMFLADSYEHDEYGYSSESAEDRVAQVDKRARKLITAAKELNGANLYGPEKAKITLVGWGSIKRPILDAMELLPEEIKSQINFLHLNIIWPFPAKQTSAILGNSKNILLIENNSQAQLGQLIRQETGIDIKEKFLKYDGRPFFPEEIAEKIKSFI